MAAVEQTFGQWLQSEADFIVRDDPVTKGRWGASARTVECVTSIATRAAALAEADRQNAFWARGPFAIDIHTVTGTDWAGELARVVTLQIDELEYSAGAEVFVVGVEPDHAIGMTTLTVIQPLGGRA
ncbi:hypothetical protein [Sphingomonas panni]|uniref:hypothetical protein n=1 Tax=Sphingomonas panni TaxID=237612 RepID=UPI001F5BCF3B|nr:hypothetical protein [Sphingomonas panni]